jgi:hypothetical protein
MKFSLINPAVSISLLLLIIGCQDLYTDENIDANETIPCVEGAVLNNNNTKLLYITNARSFYADKIESITGASAILSDLDGNQIDYTEKGLGVYRINNEAFTPIIGNSYYLTVNLPDGTTLQSIPDKIIEPIDIAEVSKNYEATRLVASKLENGTTTFTEQIGMGTFMALAAPTQTKKYFRLNSAYLLETKVIVSKTISIDSFEQIGMHVDTNHWEITYDTLVNTFTYVGNPDFPIIGELSPGVSYSADELTHMVNFFSNKIADHCDPRIFTDWIVFCDAITLSEDTYNYYSKVYDQLNEPFRIYDPVPEQLPGNIFNMADSSKVVLGWFEASSVETKTLRIYYNDYGTWESEEITDSVYPRINREIRTCVGIDTAYPNEFKY